MLSVQEELSDEDEEMEGEDREDFEFDLKEKCADLVVKIDNRVAELATEIPIEEKQNSKTNPHPNSLAEKYKKQNVVEN